MDKYSELVKIIKCLGWSSFGDDREIKPNIRSGYLYMRKHQIFLREIFGNSINKLDKNNLVNIINPFLISMWHVQIIGNNSLSKLELLITTK